MPENETVGNAKLGMKMILDADIKDVNKKLLNSLFASYHDREAHQFKDAPFKPEMRITLTKAEYPYVKESTVTTLGLLFFNRFVLEKSNIIQHLGYWNTTITKKTAGKLATQVNNLFILDKITAEQLGEFIDRRDMLGGWSSVILAQSITTGLIRPMPDVDKRKRELFEENRDKLRSSNPVERLQASNRIENELLKMVETNLKKDQGWDMYASGVNDMSNNYKTINVMRGAVYNELTKNFDVVESSLMNGINKYDIPASANTVVAGAYPSAVGTAEAGATAKIIMAVLQSVEIDPDPASDCGTRATIPFTITKNNSQYALYRNIVVDGKRVLTNLDNINSFVGKTVHMFSPQGCVNDKICAKCAGKVFANLGVTKAGLLTTEITQKLLNLKLKSKHNLSQHASIIPKDKIFIHDNPHFKIEDSYVVNKEKMKLFVPKLLESQSVFEVEASSVYCMGIIPAKFYDVNNNEIFSTLLSIPSLMHFNVYSDIQETPDSYVFTYEPNSRIVDVAIRQSLANVEYFINQIYLLNKQPIIPYNMITEMMFRCMEMNNIDLNGPSITYEFLARRLCRDESGNDTFAKVYGRNPNVDQQSYVKMWHREAVQNEGVLQSIIFQDVSKGLNVGLAATLNGRETVQSPLERIIKA